MKENKLIKIIALGPLIIIPSIVIVLTLIIAKANSEHYNESVKKLEASLVVLEKETIKTKVDAFVELIAHKKSIIKKNLLLRVKGRVDDAHKIATALYKKYKDTKTQSEIQEIIITTLRELTWNSGESFIWIMDYNGVFYLAPDYLRHLEGSSIIDFQDATGKYVIKEEIATCKQKGEGYLWDTFTKPDTGTDKQYKQVAFVKAFGQYNLYMGSGEYLDTANRASDRVVLNSIAQIDTISSNYIFILKENADIIFHASQPHLEGENLLKLDDDKFRVVYESITSSLLNSNSSFSSYKWLNPQSEKEDKKVSYVKKVPNSDWIVASGYYESTIKQKAAAQSLDLYNLYNIKLKNLIITSAILTFLLLILSYLLSRYIKNSFRTYQEKVNSKTLELSELNETLEDRVIQRTDELKQATDELKALATTDSLTNIHNRYSIMNILDVEVDRAKRHKTSLSVFMYDLDHFKRVNDTHGHKVGDDVLYTLTKVVKQSLRDIDIVGRYGGEEFLVIMPSTSLSDAVDVAQRICNTISNHKFKTVDQVTISIGLVELRSDESMDMLFTRADKLLYKSKDSGRNRVSF